MTEEERKIIRESGNQEPKAPLEFDKYTDQPKSNAGTKDTSSWSFNWQLWGYQIDLKISKLKN